jgi:siroheme decarboxylase
MFQALRNILRCIELDPIDAALIDALQSGIPIAADPFRLVATVLGITPNDVVTRIKKLLDDGVLTRFGPMFNADRMGGTFTLAALRVPPADFERVAALVNAHAEVAHNYARDHDWNMWFVIATDDPLRIRAVEEAISAETGLPILDLPKIEEYHVALKLEARA